MDSITYTPHLKLSKLPANYHVWANLMNSNLQTIDAAVNEFITIVGFAGSWANSTVYAQNDVVVDPDSAVMWMNLVPHTSMSIPNTFLQERTAYPTYWTTYSAPGAARGTWTGPGTSYRGNDFVVHNQQYAVC